MPTTTTNFTLNKPLVNDPTDADVWGGQLNDNMDDIDSELATRSADYDFASYELQDAEFIDCAEPAYSLGNISGAVTIDYTNGHHQYGTLTGNISGLTINNPPASGNLGYLTLELIQDGTGSRTLTLSGSTYKATGGTLPTLTTDASAVDELYLRTRDGGTTWRVASALDFS